MCCVFVFVCDLGLPTLFGWVLIVVGLLGFTFWWWCFVCFDYSWVALFAVWLFVARLCVLFYDVCILFVVLFWFFFSFDCLLLLDTVVIWGLLFGFDWFIGIYWPLVLYGC